MDQDLRELSRVKAVVATAASAPAIEPPRPIDRPMSYWFDEARDQHEFVRVRTFWVTIALSLIVHMAALFLVLERTRLLAPFDEEKEATSDRLQVHLAAIPQQPAPASEPAREIVAQPKPPARPPAPPPRKALPPAVIASPIAPAFPTPPVQVPAPPVPAPPRPNPSIDSDMWSYMQARRRERGEPTAPAVASQDAQANANLAANLPAPATGVATQDKKKGGGIFEVTRMTYDDAAFLFFGWNKDMGRRTPQLIEVRKGDNSDMCIAVVRRMIVIIREHEKGDFFWESPRHEHDVVLSARLADNAALENFLVHDGLCDDPRRSR